MKEIMNFKGSYRTQRKLRRSQESDTSVHRLDQTGPIVRRSQGEKSDKVKRNHYYRAVVLKVVVRRLVYVALVTSPLNS